MKHTTSIVGPVLVFAAVLAAPIASAECDISETKCAVNGGKCNIKFRNRTSDSSGSDGSSAISQTSSAQTIVVKAIDEESNHIGNKLQIVAGASKTMNVENKVNKDKGFDAIKIDSKDFSGHLAPVTMSCEHVQAVLNGNGTCKVFHGYAYGHVGPYDFALGYQCDGGNVGGPKRD
ncbi:MAG: hypothetical protein AAFY82_07405 [Pseudomonadota bacterium]